MTKRRSEKLHGPVCNFSGRHVVLAFMNAILVTGATGNVGRPLVTQLAAAGVEVRAVTRQSDAARMPAGVEVVGTAVEGLPGASAVFLNSRALGDELEQLVARACREGVTRLVALSAINADDDFSRQPSRFRGDRNKEVEQLAVDSGLEWVSLRPTVFITNFIGMWAPQIQAGNVVNGPFATASTAPIVDRDISAVAAEGATHRRACGPQDSVDRTAGVHQRGVGARSSARFFLARCATRRSRPNSCASASSGWDSHPSSPTPTSRFWRRRFPSRHWSPTRWRRSSAGPPRHSPKSLRPIARCSPTY